MGKFKIKSDFKPAGDQPKAIQQLTEGIQNGLASQVLLGVTGSGKTYTIANVIEKIQRPTLVIAHNKTLAAQLCSEFRQFFPDNAVEYFVSYYDYYQPEAYVPSSDTYIEKDASINDEIDKLRHSATSSLQERRDVIVVASVSCIYSLGDPKEYLDMSISLRPGMTKSRDEVIHRLIDIQYERNDIEFERGTFRVRGDVLEIFQSYATESAVRVEFFGDEIEKISDIEVVTGKVINQRKHVAIFPASHYVMNKESMAAAIENIERDLMIQVKEFEDEGKLLEAQRIQQRTMFDIEMMRELGYCSGIENYSRYFDKRQIGEPSFTLIDYFPDDFMLIIDESHMTVPQIGAMYAGDRSRKESLVTYGFRLPSAYDNRPLTFEEFNAKIGQVVYISATPARYEMQKAGAIVEQIIRPTGLVDPEVIVKPIDGQIDDLIGEIRYTINKGFRCLITTLTKKMSERLTDYLLNLNFKAEYLHSDISTLERIEILKKLRKGTIDMVVGINLLREGLDLPEVALVAILDADKEGFLRSATALVQTIGRAARNSESRVIMYADTITDSMQNAIDETNRRRSLQVAYNEEHNITPQSIVKALQEDFEISKAVEEETAEHNKEKYLDIDIEALKAEMENAAKALNFEKAAQIRDFIRSIVGENND
ncbi:MAG: excinuclease ABC subunit UvrB [Clostridia bacterium]|nr:excinuclease ABC subunit UvrB [Clostridia bacterium]